MDDRSNPRRCSPFELGRAEITFDLGKGVQDRELNALKSVRRDVIDDRCPIDAKRRKGLEVGLNACFSVGKRVAETAKMVKLGLGQLGNEEMGWPKGPVGS